MTAVFDDPYLATLNNEYTGYATRSTMDIIEHIYKHYACISSMDMAANNERLRASCNTKEPLESLIKRLNEYADFTTAASEPVSETQLVRIAYGLVYKTGQYPEDCRAWSNQDNKYWASSFRPISSRNRPTSERGRKPHARAAT